MHAQTICLADGTPHRSLVLPRLDTLSSPLPTSVLAVAPPATKAFPRSPTMVRMRSDAYRHVPTCFRPFPRVQPLSTCPLAPSLHVRGVCPLPRHTRPPRRMPALPLCQSDSRIAGPHAMLVPTRDASPAPTHAACSPLPVQAWGSPIHGYYRPAQVSQR